MELEIVHDESINRFVVEMNGMEAYVEYRREPGKIDLYRTYVPKPLGGRGIAGQLVAFALSYAEEQGLEVIPGCSYVRSYIEKHRVAGEEGA